MSYLKPNTAGVYDIPAINASRQLYIRGIPFETYINQLVIEDQFEQAEITELKLLVQYLNTSGLSSEWIVDNNNKNQDLKTLITALETKLTNINTTALTESSVLNNDNRNSVLKTRIDGNDTSLTTLNGKTRYVTSVQGNNTVPKVASDFQVSIGDRDKRSIYMTTGANFISCINDSTNQATPGNYADNQITLESANGMITSTANMNRVEGTTVEITGPLGMGVQSDTTIKIGQGGSQIKIGSEDTPQLFPESNTVVTIGKRSNTRNTETYLRGNMFLADARFEDLAKSQAFTWQNFLALISTSGMPAWVASAILTSLVPDYVYSDLWSMKGNITKDGDVETTTKAKMKGLTIFDPEVNIDILPKIQTWLAKGDISETTLLGSIRAQTFNGEILLRNNNILATNINWALTDAMDKVNALKISNNDIELIAGAGAVNSQLRISNTTGGRIRFRSGTNTGLQANAHDALSIFGNQASTQVVIAGNDAPSGYDTTTKLLVDHQNLANGIKVTNHQNALVTRINHNNINTPSLTLQSNVAGAVRTIYLDNTDRLWYDTNKIHTGDLLTSNTGGAISVKALTLDTTVAYTGTTTNTVYISNNELYFNGQKVATGTILSSGGGGLVFVMSIGDPAIITPPFTTQNYSAVSVYTPRAAGSIKFQNYSSGVIYNLFNHQFYFNTSANPILTGLYEYNAYINYVGNIQTYIYNEAHFRATADYGYVIEKLYTLPSGTGFLGPSYPNQSAKTNEIQVNFFQYVWKIQSVTFYSFNYNGNLTLRCTLEDENEVVHYTFPTLSFNVGFTVNNVTFDAGSIQTITAPFLTPCTRLRFKVAMISGTGYFSQPSANNINNMEYRVNGNNYQASFTTPLYLGVNQKTELTSNVGIKNYTDINIPIAPYEASHFRQGLIDVRLFFTQPTGTTTNHFAEFWFGDGFLSHIHTTLANLTATPSLSTVLTEGNSAGSSTINMNNNNITGINALIGTDGIQYVVKSIVAANPSGGIVVTNNGGVVTIGSSSAGGSGIENILSNINNGTTSFAGYTSNAWTYPNLNWDFTTNNYDIEFELDLNAIHNGHVFWNWDNFSTGLYLNSFQDKDMLNNNLYNGNNHGPFLFFLQNYWTTLNFNFRGTLRTTRPTRSRALQLILEGTTTYTVLGDDYFQYTGGGIDPATRIGYSRCQNTLVASSTSSTFFNGSHNLSFWSNVNNIAANNNFYLRVTRVPK